MDVKSAVLNNPLSELVYVEQLQGFEDPKFFQTMCTSSIRRSMGLSKLLEHGRDVFRIFFSRMTL
jgi:hypothetical protein